MCVEKKTFFAGASFFFIAIKGNNFLYKMQISIKLFVNSDGLGRFLIDGDSCLYAGQ